MPNVTGYYYPQTRAKLVIAEQMLDDGCSYREIERTLHVKSNILRKEFPGRGWTQSEGGKLAMAMRKAEKQDFKFGGLQKLTENPSADRYGK
jgi:hypothetical protein